MHTVSALMWKNMFMNPVYGLFAWATKFLGLQPIHRLADPREHCRDLPHAYHR